MTAHICDDEAMRAVFELQEVEVIAGNDLCRTAERRNIVTRDGRNLLR